ncbi:MAG: tetratricopeptide repeat protein [Gammaproteobacteria bacterium]|nr:tetratricopeptide repeat protein [Gammaproteobacteria bacterium]
MTNQKKVHSIFQPSIESLTALRQPPPLAGSVRSLSVLGAILLLAVIWLSGCAAPGTKQFSQDSTKIQQSTNQPKEVVSLEVREEFQQALASVAAGKLDEGEKLLRAMTEKYPKLAGPYANLGIIYVRKERTEEAEQAFKKAIALSPEIASVHNYLGVLYRNSGRFEEAKKAYQDALNIDAMYAYANLNLAILYDLYLRDLENALLYYQRYQELMESEDKQVALWIRDIKMRLTSAKK